MLVLAPFVVSKNASNEVKRLQKNGPGRPRLVAVVCSLNVLEMLAIDLCKLNKTFAMLTVLV